MWKAKVKKVYSSLKELREYDKTFNIAKRLGYPSCKKLWEENPTICGSINPNDFSLYKKEEKNASSN